MVYLFLLLSQIGFSQTVEPVEPKTLCERFINEAEKKTCFDKLSAVMPDGYLAAVCDQQFDTDQFYKCLELSSKMQFDPKSLYGCAKPMMDDERVECLTSVGKADLSRMPASTKKKKKK